MLAGATVDDDIDQVLVTFVDLLGIGEIAAHLIFLIHQGGGHDGGAQLFHQVGDDGLVGDADAHGLLLALEDPRDVVVGIEDESEGAGEVAFHHLIDLVADGTGELAQHAQVVEDEREVGFLFLDALDATDAIQHLWAADVAAHAIDRVGREDDDTVVVEVKNHHDGKELPGWFVMYHNTPEMLMFLSIAYNSVHNPDFKASQEELDALMNNFDASWKEAWGHDVKAEEEVFNDKQPTESADA